MPKAGEWQSLGRRKCFSWRIFPVWSIPLLSGAVKGVCDLDRVVCVDDKALQDAGGYVPGCHLPD